MSATTNENENPFVVGTRVVLNDEDYLFYKEKGTVVYVSGTLTEVKLDRGITVATSFKKFKKLGGKNASKKTVRKKRR